jgi:hypothetical protein
MVTLIIAVVLTAMAGGIYGLHRLGVYLERRGFVQYWKGHSGSGGGYNPLQELVLPQARHVVEVQEQRAVHENEGAPPQPSADQD